MKKYLLPDYQDLVETQWDYSLNKGINPSEVSHGSSLKPFWKCLNGEHSFPAFVHRMVRGGGCPVCAGKLVVVGVNNVGYTDKEVLKYLVDQKVSDMYTRMSHKSVEWYCDKGHTYFSQISSWVKGHRCPYCSRRLPIVGETDLATESPKLFEELVDKSLATKLMVGSGTEVLWECPRKHTYEMAVYKRHAGRGCPVCSNHRSVLGVNTIEVSAPKLASKLSSTNISRMSGKDVLFTCENGHTRLVKPYNMDDEGSSCPTCSNNGTSSYEEIIVEFLREHLGEDRIKVSDRSVISPKELDIYVPDKMVAIEFNGLYWHTENRVGVDYHKNKAVACREKGIQLIQIWEDDYKNNKDLVNQTLLHKLGVSTLPKVFARDTEVREISFEESSVFLNQYHIQGSATGSIRLGLYIKDSDELVAVTVFKNTSKELKLERYATSKHVIGGQSKFLSYVDRNVSYVKMVTFADLTISDGNLYEKTGWTKDKVLPPDYKYLYRGKLHHKFNFRLKRFRDDPNLQYQEGLTERELASLNGILRVYDAGKIRYVRNNPNK